MPPPAFSKNWPHGASRWARPVLLRLIKCATILKFKTPSSRWLRREAKRDAFRWPEDVRSDLLRLRFGNADSWQDPDAVFRAAKASWRSP